jgi:hypothetical protein
MDTSTPLETPQLSTPKPPLPPAPVVEGDEKNLSPQFKSLDEEVSTLPSEEVIVAHRCEQVVEPAEQLLEESIASPIEEERSSTKRRSAGFFSSLLCVDPQFASPDAGTAVLSGSAASAGAVDASGSTKTGPPAAPPWFAATFPPALDGDPPPPANELPAAPPPLPTDGATLQAITKHPQNALATEDKACSKRFIAASPMAMLMISSVG